MMTRGFTLIESLVVVFIILVLTLITLPSYRSGEKILSLEQAAARLEQDLRRAQALALSAKEFHGVIPRGGYGLYFSLTSSYILFADCSTPPNYQYDAGGAGCNGFPEKVEQVFLPNVVSVASLSPSSPLTIVYTSPTPLVTFSGAGNNASIILQLTDNAAKNKTIRANKAGLVEILP